METSRAVKWGSRFLVVCAVMTALMCGCESDDDGSSDDSSGISTNPATQLLGVWIGPAGRIRVKPLSSFHRITWVLQEVIMRKTVEL